MSILAKKLNTNTATNDRLHNRSASSTLRICALRPVNDTVLVSPQWYFFVLEGYNPSISRGSDLTSPEDAPIVHDCSVRSQLVVIGNRGCQRRSVCENAGRLGFGNALQHSNPLHGNTCREVLSNGLCFTATDETLREICVNIGKRLHKARRMTRFKTVISQF